VGARPHGGLALADGVTQRGPRRPSRFPSAARPCTTALSTDLPARFSPQSRGSAGFIMMRLLSSLALAGLAFSALPAAAQAPSLVIDASSGAVLIAEDATRPWNPASTTKMMTAYVALRAVRNGQAQMDSPLVASARAAGQKPSKIGIRPGQEITLENALKVLMVKSANDVAVVIAEAIGGSVEGFSRMMNAEAQRLGMTESRFENPHGFHAEGHQTSARDLAVLARALLVDFPEHRDMWGIGAVQLGNRTLNNTNGLIGRYSGASGMKTGFVCASGFNLVSTATRGGRTLIAVVLGASSGGDRVVRSAQLLDQAFGMWGGTGQTLQTLPRSGYSSAPNMRSTICSGRRRGVVLADDSDYGGALLSNTQGVDAMNGSPLAFFSVSQSAAPTRRYGVSSGRAVLGPRVGIVPQQIYLGRAPGSTAVALGPGARAAQQTASAPAGAAPIPGLPSSASAMAPVPGLRSALPASEARPGEQAGIRPQGQATAARAAEPAAAGDAGGPLQLPGVITNGPRPGAQAGIRPRQTGPAPRAQPPTAERRAAVATTPKAQGPKVQRPKAQAAKVQPKKQPAAPRKKLPAGAAE
jgi:D-alanyl-D-alanine carboxypeptidase